MKPKLFIVGGAGYLGSALSMQAIKEGWEVVVYDALIYKQNISEIFRKIVTKKGYIQPVFIKGDTRNKTALIGAVEEHKPTWLIHFGELVGVYACEKDPKRTRDINFTGTKNVVDICTQLGIPLIYNSSSSVYGADGGGKLMKETARLPVPDDQYCKNKLLVEKYIEKKVKNKKLKAIIFRPATICGPSPRMRIDLLPNHFSYISLVNREIRISQPNAGRAVMDINDLIDAFIKVIKKGSWKRPVYNLGHYSWPKIRYAQCITRITGAKIINSNNLGDKRNLGIDSEMFEKEFKFKPRISFSQSVKNIVQWINKNRKYIKKNNFSGIINMPISVWKKLI